MTMAFDGMKVFCATTSQRRNSLGETVTDWLNDNPDVTPVEATMVQSSDEAYHCVTMVLCFTGTPTV